LCVEKTLNAERTTRNATVGNHSDAKRQWESGARTRHGTNQQ